MKISEKKVVELIYELKVEGETVDKTTADRPLDFIQGTGCLLPLFEKNIEGKEPGDKFSFTLTPAQGYGERDDSKVIDLPKSAFEVDGQIREDLMVIGSIVPLMNSMGGVIPAKVVAVGTDSVTMDINHPMAGKTLDFSGEILTVRDATEKELTEGLHGEFAQAEGCGHGSCGNCGGCGSEEKEEGCCSEKKEGCCSKKEGEGKKKGGCCRKKKEE